MRVRHLQSHLADQALVHHGGLEKLRGVRVGVDAVFWLRTIQSLKDPFADALGGIPPGIFGFVDKELEHFERHEITPLFVFQGVAPGPQHSMFGGRMEEQMQKAWNLLATGNRAEAQKFFATSTSRINGDFVYFIFHHLRAKGYECLLAPYFAGAQLAHFAAEGVISTVFGPPGLLLYGVQSVVIQINFATSPEERSDFQWVDLESVLNKWAITRDQFVDACMLAGTEYCLTYPYLNLGHFQAPAPGKFNFDAAVYIIKQAPLINWMQTFPTEDMKNDHVDGYCICKVLVQNSPVLHVRDHTIRPLGASSQVPVDFSNIMGEKLPNPLYYLMLKGILSHKLPQALAKGEWMDKSQPLVDTVEFRTLLEDLPDVYRKHALGLIAQHLHQGFQTKTIMCKAFYDSSTFRQGLSGEGSSESTRSFQPCITKWLRWRVTKDAVEAEMRRQNVTKVDFRFCLNWHANEWDRNDSELMPNNDQDSAPTVSNDLNSLCALVHLMVLEQSGYITQSGEMTHFGNVLKDSPSLTLEPCMVALEMMKLGVLSGDPFEAPPGRPFPPQVDYPEHADDRTKAVMLLTRVMSLVPMNLKGDEMWNADVDFDLTAFHSLVRILKRALRQLVEASLASVLLKEGLTLWRLLPPGFMCASGTPARDDAHRSPAVLPTFMLPRACMGIVVRYFLKYTGPPGNFAQDVAQKFPCCVDVVPDLQVAFAFWKDLRRCLDAFPKTQDPDAEDSQQFVEEMTMANEVLEAQQRRLGIFPAEV